MLRTSIRDIILNEDESAPKFRGPLYDENLPNSIIQDELDKKHPQRIDEYQEIV